MYVKIPDFKKSLDESEITLEKSLNKTATNLKHDINQELYGIKEFQEQL